MKSLVKFVVAVTIFKVFINFYHGNWYFDKKDNFVDVMYPKSTTIIEKAFEKLDKEIDNGKLLERIIEKKLGGVENAVMFKTNQKSEEQGFYSVIVSDFENAQNKLVNPDLIKSDEIVDMSDIEGVREGMPYVGVRKGENIEVVFTSEDIAKIYEYFAYRTIMLNLNLNLYNKLPTNEEIMKKIDERPWYALSYDWVATLFTNKLDYYSEIVFNGIIEDILFKKAEKNEDNNE